jgi:hypothetical protein
MTTFSENREIEKQGLPQRLLSTKLRGSSRVGADDFAILIPVMDQSPDVFKKSIILPS